MAVLCLHSGPWLSNTLAFGTASLRLGFSLQSRELLSLNPCCTIKSPNLKGKQHRRKQSKGSMQQAPSPKEAERQEADRSPIVTVHQMPHLPEHRAEGSLEGLLQTGTPVSPRSKHPGAPGCHGGKFMVAGSETSGGSPEKAGSPSLIRFTVLRFVSADQTERIYPPNCLGQRARQKLG